jgi:ATP-dependent RNA helicase DHX37/DHR1
MKNMHIDAVINFPFPTPPERPALERAEKLLLHLGALTNSSAVSTQFGPVSSQVTDLGRTMALFPVSPRFARMLAVGQQHQCLPYVITIVSAMSVEDPFLYQEAIGTDDGIQDTNEDISYLTSEAAKAEESRRRRRKAFFQSQHVYQVIELPNLG